MATRFHHFGDVLHLPDASLAVFFFTGFYRKKAFFGFLLVLAALIDYLAIENGPTRDGVYNPRPECFDVAVIFAQFEKPADGVTPTVWMRF